ncbi:RRNA methyltransferase AviRa [Marinactinospora thermotolerans DSM 45154]|uniref:rRNA methyltransferase AviRa n=1 Tax=Marinactinospora thermotolerans DSM 45154 TaxID=1122192 RepID=A0A1T4R189_9ACTN|nr:rRNA methyltransferase [Marinactinospora thermotolerans]SKA09773.1 RRNA methyltransferase AviRa [Marinactinospora thermotolerans DSM 45154]
MAYRHVTERADFTDLASGQVLRSAPGFPGFPVRLASELLQRALAHLPQRPVSLWDPCCGSGYLATVLGLSHRDRLSHVRVGDVDSDAVALAARNLELLTVEGLAARERELRAHAEEYGRPSFLERARAAARLADGLVALGGDLPHAVEVADVFAPRRPRPAVDVVVTDVPYGDLTHWAGDRPAGEPVTGLLRTLAGVLEDHAVLVVTARTRKIALPEGVRPLERVRVGNRAAVVVRAARLR